jgi:hypothetical protein
MSRATVRKIYLPGLVLAIIGAVLWVIAMQGGHTVTTQSGATGMAPGNGLLSGIGTACLVIGGILSFIAWIGALVGTAMLGRWGWFVALLVLNLIGLGLIIMLVYCFAGPTERSGTTPVAAT